MKWTIEYHKSLNSRLELELGAMLNEMIQYTWTSSAESFESIFNELIKSLPITNNFTAHLMYKVKIIDLYTVEIWKLTADGDLKHKFFTLKYIRS